LFIATRFHVLHVIIGTTVLFYYSTVTVLQIYSLSTVLGMKIGDPEFEGNIIIIELQGANSLKSINEK
jgi:hypothetical protein